MAISSMPIAVGRRLAGAAELFAHVLLVEFLDRVPIQEQFVGHRLDRTVPATSSHEEGKALGVKGIVGQPVQTFGLHGATPAAVDTANVEVEIDPLVAAREIADLTWPLIVEGRRGLPTHSAGRFFPRRWSVTTTARESPKSPRTVARGANPAKR
jgi:hypothetical protein